MGGGLEDEENIGKGGKLRVKEVERQVGGRLREDRRLEKMRGRGGKEKEGGKTDNHQCSCWISQTSHSVYGSYMKKQHQHSCSLTAVACRIFYSAFYFEGRLVVMCNHTVNTMSLKHIHKIKINKSQTTSNTLELKQRCSIFVICPARAQHNSFSTKHTEKVQTNKQRMIKNKLENVCRKNPPVTDISMSSCCVLTFFAIHVQTGLFPFQQSCTEVIV